MRGVILMNSNLASANLADADLSFVNILSTRGDRRVVRFPSTLTGASLDKTICTNADFSGARLDGVSFETAATNGAIFGAAEADEPETSKEASEDA